MSAWDKIVSKLELIVGVENAEASAAATPAQKRRRLTADEKLRHDRIDAANRDAMRATNAAIAREAKKRRVVDARPPSVAEVVCDDPKARAAHDCYLWAIADGEGEYQPIVNGRMPRL